MTVKPSRTLRSVWKNVDLFLNSIEASFFCRHLVALLLLQLLEVPSRQIKGGSWLTGDKELTRFISKRLFPALTPTRNKREKEKEEEREKEGPAQHLFQQILQRSARRAIDLIFFWQFGAFGLPQVAQPSIFFWKISGVAPPWGTCLRTLVRNREKS